MSPPPDPGIAYPVHVFRFQVDFGEVPLHSEDGARGSAVPLCSGAFAECTGLEVTMEPKTIREGGKNFGANHRAGPVTFATVILKRGMTRSRDLWNWMELVGNGAYSYRLAATVTMNDHENRPLLSWRLERALPVKFKAADLNARGTDVGVEELHIAHEGLRLVPRDGGGGGG
jgi:phage tail-like protein